MISKNLLRIALISTALIGGAVASANAKDAASAAGTGKHQNHHCKQADGSMDMGKTKKACLAAKGTWLKDGQDAAAPAAAGSAAAKK